MNILGRQLKKFFEAVGSRNGVLVIAYMTLVGAFLNLGWSFLVVGWVTRAFGCENREAMLKTDFMDEIITSILKYTSLGVHGFAIGTDFLHIGDYVVLLKEKSVYNYIHVSLLDALRLVLCCVWLNASLGYILAIYHKRQKHMFRMIRLTIMKILVQICTIIVPMYLFPYNNAIKMFPFFGMHQQNFTTFFKVMQFVDILLSLFVVWAMRKHLYNIQDKCGNGNCFKNLCNGHGHASGIEIHSEIGTDSFFDDFPPGLNIEQGMHEKFIIPPAIRAIIEQGLGPDKIGSLINAQLSTKFGEDLSG